MKEFITLIILALFILISYRYSQLKQHEYFVDELPSPENNNTITTHLQPPDSTYNMRQYYLERPPTSSTVVKNQTVHRLPDGIVESDLILSEQNKLGFGSTDDSNLSNGSFYFKPSANGKNIKLQMKDNPNYPNAFQIWGGSCISQGNCNGEGANLHSFDDKPEYNIKTPAGNTKHKLDAIGIAHHTGGIKLGPQTNPKHLFDGNTGNQYSKGIVNGNDINVRNRLYFSQAGYNANLTPTSSNWWSVHNSDPFYVEKVKSGHETNALRFTINDNGNDSFEVYGGSCGAAGGCYGPGKLLFKIKGNGNVEIPGTLKVGGRTI